MNFRAWFKRQPKRRRALILAITVPPTVAIGMASAVGLIMVVMHFAFSYGVWVGGATIVGILWAVVGLFIHTIYNDVSR